MDGFIRMLAGMTMAALLVACGGGDEESAPEPDEASAAGHYLGTIPLNGSVRAFSAVVASDGTFTGTIAPSTSGGPDLRVFIGTSVSSGNGFAATGTAYAFLGGAFPAGGFSAALTLTNGTLVERQQLTGTYSAGGESSAFALSFHAELTDRGALLSRLAGTYNWPSPGPTGLTAAMTFTSTGAMTYQTSAGCSGTGSVTIQDPAINVYNFSIDLGACGPVAAYTAAGLLVLQDGPGGGVNNLVSLFGTDVSRSPMFSFSGIR